MAARLGYAERSVSSRSRQLRHFTDWMDGRSIEKTDQKLVEKYANYLHEKVSDRTGLGLGTRTIEAYLSVLVLPDTYRQNHGQAPLFTGAAAGAK
jgi:site-specific recombinase XerD